MESVFKARKDHPTFPCHLRMSAPGRWPGGLLQTVLNARDIADARLPDGYFRKGSRPVSAGIAQPGAYVPRTSGDKGPDFARLVGRLGWSRLDPEIRRRFAPGHAAQPITYSGAMTLSRSAAGAVFALLSGVLGGPLPLRRGANIRSAVQVRSDGRGGIVWERRLRFPGRTRPICVRSIKRADGAGGLLECVEGGLGMALDVFEAHRALVFQSKHYFLNLAGIRLRLPAMFSPGRCRVAHRAAGPGRFEFSLEMIHPLWGRTFTQTGIFKDPETPQ